LEQLLVTQQHYRWDSKRQRWKIDRFEIVVGVVALFVAVLALSLVVR
jgi:hypothetical protein